MSTLVRVVPVVLGCIAFYASLNACGGDDDDNSSPTSSTSSSTSSSGDTSSSSSSSSSSTSSSTSTGGPDASTADIPATPTCGAGTALAINFGTEATKTSATAEGTAIAAATNNGVGGKFGSQVFNFTWNGTAAGTFKSESAGTGLLSVRYFQPDGTIWGCNLASESAGAKCELVLTTFGRNMGDKVTGTLRGVFANANDMTQQKGAAVCFDTTIQKTN